ncbi:MAG: U32 family peptidase, partial [Muribaculaceae bacterium]|nr:U32 family peptidase [Muribaculaceae bacterium]
MRKLELLAPAANIEVGRQAILHGADAVYIGATSHGARHNASNSIDDIAELVKFAHQFRAKVYVTVNTLVYENEIKTVEKLIDSLYRIRVDALIIQDMGILRMDIPPIALHSSTQCDTRTVEKAKFLEKAGFSQIVLARELSLEEIKDICHSVSVPVETFIHGALCVCYSGRCQASEVCMNRSANRGECGQMCRLPYTLRNSTGDVLLKDKYLLSLSDFNSSNNIFDLIEAGVS